MGKGGRERQQPGRHRKSVAVNRQTGLAAKSDGGGGSENVSAIKEKGNSSRQAVVTTEGGQQ